MYRQHRHVQLVSCDLQLHFSIAVSLMAKLVFMLLQDCHFLMCLWVLMLVLSHSQVLLLHSLSISKLDTCSTAEALHAGWS